MYIRWYNGLFDTGGSRGNDIRKKAYLSNAVKNLESKIIVAKEMSFVGITDSKYMLYTSFRNYVDLCQFIQRTPSFERRFHEASPANSRQKPRFDIDIKKSAHAKFVLEHPGALQNHYLFGEYVKDMVITTAMQVLSFLGVVPELRDDVMLFESHGQNKRSYHLVLNRYYQNGSTQAQAFYNSCLERCETDLDRAAFSTFVDPGPYSRNALLRIVWSGKQDGMEYRTKKYVNVYNYLNEKIVHNLPNYKHSNIEVRRMTVLLHSLVSFTDEAEALPNLANAPMPREVHTEDIDETTFQYCKLAIEKWDTEQAFCVLEADGSIIRLERIIDSLCPICSRVHESNPFCYVNDNGLYWHCSRAKGVSGVLISTLDETRGYRTSSSLLERVNACRVASGMEGLEGIEIEPVRSKEKTLFTVLGEEIEIEAEIQQPEIETEPQQPEIETEAQRAEIETVAPQIEAHQILKRKPIKRSILAPPEVKTQNVQVVDALGPAQIRIVHSSPIITLRTQKLSSSSNVHTTGSRTSRSTGSGSRSLKLDWND